MDTGECAWKHYCNGSGIQDKDLTRGAKSSVADDVSADNGQFAVHTVCHKTCNFKIILDYNSHVSWRIFK